MAIRGRVDGMQGRDVTGWALPASGRKPCTITVTDEDGNPVAKGAAAQPRPDLAALGLGRNNLAFRLELPDCVQRRRFRVFADGVELPGSPLEAGPGRYDGDCMVDRGVLKGWVRERVPELTAPSISIVTQHGVVVGQTQSGRDTESESPRAAFEIPLHDRCYGAGELRLAVLADGIGFAETSCNLSLQGSIDLITPEVCSGWLIAPDVPEKRLEIEIFRNDVAVAITRCGVRRQDVHDIFPRSTHAGFAATLPAGNAPETEAVRISLRLRGSAVELFDGPYIVAGQAAATLAAQRAARVLQAEEAIGPAEKSVIQQALRQFLATARTEKFFSAARQTDHAPKNPQARLTIIIPIYRDIAATRLCIDSVLKHRTAATDRMVLINDASPEPGMAEVLEAYAPHPNLFLLTHDNNLGFIKTVNHGFAFAGFGDVLLLNSDTIVYPGAFDELSAIAQSAPGIGTVTALSNDATIFSYPGEDLRQQTLADCGWDALAAAALAANAGRAVDVPTGHGFCLLIKAELLRKLGNFDESFGRGYGEENDFCTRAADLGYRHVAATGVFVQHGASLSFGEEKEPLLKQNLDRLAGKYPEYFPKLREFKHRDGLRSARWALDAWRLSRARQAGTQFVLVISNHLGGGSEKAMHDIEREVGYGSAAKLSLNCRNNGSWQVFAEQPVFHASFATDEVEDLFELLDAAAPHHVLAHQLLGFPAAFLRRLAEWVRGRNSVYYLHDFYALCPRVTLIDAIGRFCDVAETRICERCIALDGARDTSQLSELDPTAHRALFGKVLGNFTQVIAPSKNAADYLRRGFPELPVNIIPHPESATSPPGAPIRQAQDPEEIVLFGALGPHKGSGKLLEIARRAKMIRPSLVFRVIGYTSLDEELLKLGNVIITGRYTPETFPQLTADARGNLALFLHEWPETWSYTLSEALRSGFLPLVPDIGAPAERVRALQFGIVYPFPSDAAQILQLIEDVLSGKIPRLAEGRASRVSCSGVQAVAQMRAVLNIPPPPAKSRRKRNLTKNS